MRHVTDRLIDEGLYEEALTVERILTERANRNHMALEAIMKIAISVVMIAVSGKAPLVRFPNISI